jgi:hypothetical protein
MKRILFFIAVLSVSVISLTFNSCKKETPDTETQSSVDNTVCESEFNKSLPLVNSFTIKEQGIKSNRTIYPIITVDTTTNPRKRKLTIDFGTAGCIDSIGDYKVRKGYITATFDTTWHIAGAKAIVKFYNYTVANTVGGEDVHFEVDSMIIIHNSLGSFTHTVIGGKCVGSNYTLQWNSTRTVTQTEGMTTIFDHTDDVFSTTGNSNGVDRNGKKYTVNISSPLIKRAGCAWIEQGTLDLTPEGLSARTIDYGNGTCDSKATLTINGNTFTFNMN